MTKAQDAAAAETTDQAQAAQEPAEEPITYAARRSNADIGDTITYHRADGTLRELHADNGWIRPESAEDERVLDSFGLTADGKE